jgi:hypothetical protein
MTMAMNEDEFGQMLDAAMDAMERKNDELTQRFGIGRAQEWKADLEVPVIRFLNGGQVIATADLLVVGSLSHNNSWMWGWANQSLPEHVRTASDAMKDFGPETGLEFFTGPKWSADEELAWWFCALACSRLQGEGTYRMPGAKADVYAVMKNVRKADS